MVNYSLLHLSSWLVSPSSSRHDVQLSAMSSPSRWSVQSFGLPSYHINVTSSMIQSLRSRPLIQTDFVNGHIPIKPGHSIHFGDDIGFKNPMCQKGFWPIGSYCPRRIIQRYSFPLIPTIDEVSNPNSRLGNVIGVLVNGVPLYSFYESTSYRDLLTWEGITNEYSKYTLDICGGHAHSDHLYHYHQLPLCLQQRLRDDGTLPHSPIYGWMMDGFPLYGPYHNGSQRVKSCWFKRDYSSDLTGCADGLRSCILNDNMDFEAGTFTLPELLHGPPFDEITTTSSSLSISARLGMFYQDYYFNVSCFQEGGPHLNHFNGHDHDELGFHYHITIDDSGEAVFPFIMGPTFFGVVPETGPIIPHSAIIAGALLSVFLIFYTASIICDDYLIPCVELFIIQFQMPEELAAVTLVSLGNAAPELVLDLLGAAKSTPSLSIPTTLGTAMTAFGLIPPLCVFSCRSKDFVISAFPLFREVVFYLMGLLIFLFAIFDGYIQTLESLFLTGLYAVYLFVVIFFYYHGNCKNTRDIETEPLTDDDNNENLPNISQTAVSTPVSWSIDLRWIIKLLVYPLEYFINIAMPSLQKDSTKTHVGVGRSLFVMAISVLVMGCLSYAIICVCELIVEELGVDPSTIGATLVAIGAEIPDILSAIALAKRGYFDGAMASAIGSQVVNISLGIGLPSLLVCLFGKGVVMIHANVTSIWLLAQLVFVVISSYIIAIFPLSRLFSCCFIFSNERGFSVDSTASKTNISRLGALFLLIIYISTFSFFVVENEDGD